MIIRYSKFDFERQNRKYYKFANNIQQQHKESQDLCTFNLIQSVAQDLRL